MKISKSGYYFLQCKSYVVNGCTAELYDKDLTHTKWKTDLYNAKENKPSTLAEDFYLDKGIYYLKISTMHFANFGRGRYLLTWNKLTQKNCSHNYSETMVDSTYLKKGYILHKCNKCGKTYKSNYIPKLTLENMSCSAIAMKKKVKLMWQKVNEASGYQIRYSNE